MHYDDGHDNDDDTLYKLSLPYLTLRIVTDGKLEFNVLSQNIIIFITSCPPITYTACMQLRSKPRMCYKSSVRLDNMAL
jgi:hypothetical protein